MNHKLVDFMNAIRQQKVTPGCGLIQEDEHEHEHEQEQSHMFEEDGGDEYVKEHVMEDSEDDNVETVDLCAGNRCKHESKCVQQPPSDYMCKCTAGWSGKFCDQGWYFFSV